MNILKSTVLGLSFIATIASCKKDDAVTQLPGNTPVKQIVQDANNYAKFDYNGQGLLSKLQVVNDGDASESVIAYNADKKAQTATIAGFIMRFKYANGVLDKIEYKQEGDPTNEVISFLKFNYANNRIVNRVGYAFNDNDLVETSKTAYEYYANGDLKTLINFVSTGTPGQFIQTDKTVYEYDDKANPFVVNAEVSYALFLNPSPHNITKQLTYDADNVLEETSTFAYTYNSKGLPATGVETITTPTNDPVVKNVTYPVLK